MSETITIPTTVEDAVEHLGGLGALITARKWERAAIVAAFVRLDLGSGGRQEASTSGDFESASSFAARSIVGLSSITSVTKYVQAWLDKHDGNYPRPGSKRRLPTVPFPPMRTGTNGYSSEEGAEKTAVRILSHDPGVFAKAFASVPGEQKEMIAQEVAVREDFIEAVRTNPVVRDILVGALTDRPDEREKIEVDPLFGWQATAEGLRTAKTGVNKGVDALVKLSINARVNPDDDLLDLANLRAEQLGRVIAELETLWGETPISDAIAARRGVEA